MITGDVDVIGDLDSSFGTAGHKTQQNVFKRKWKEGSWRQCRPCFQGILLQESKVMCFLSVDKGKVFFVCLFFSMGKITVFKC